MKNNLLTILIFCGIFLFNSACKSEYEKIRGSGDTELLLKKAYEYYDQEEWLRSQNLFELVIGAYKGRPEAEKAYFYYAYTQYHLGKYILASYYFKNFTSTFPNSQYREESDFMEGYAHYNLSPSYRLDQTYTEKAISAFQLFVNTYPESSRVEKCNNLISEMRIKMEQKAYAEAELYYDLRQYQSATKSFENLLRDFPDTNKAENVRFLMTKASYNLAYNSVFAKKEERFSTAYDNAMAFKKRYPNSSYQKEIETIEKNSTKQIKIIQNVGH